MGGNNAKIVCRLETEIQISVSDWDQNHRLVSKFT